MGELAHNGEISNATEVEVTARDSGGPNRVILRSAIVPLLGLSARWKMPKSIGAGGIFKRHARIRR